MLFILDLRTCVLTSELEKTAFSAGQDQCEHNARVLAHAHLLFEDVV